MLKEQELSNKIRKLEGRRDMYVRKINLQISEIQKELESICTHSEYKVIEQNYEGGYDHVAEYNKITECKFCGKELDRKTSYGGYA